MRQIKRIFVHCTAGPQTQTVQEIQKYWKTHNKWKDPGYHYIIKPDGEIIPLQPEDKPSNGVAGYNSTSINVCYIGGVDKQGRAIDNRTDAQKQALSTILKDLHSRYPDAEIMGHRDIWGSDSRKWKKMCPCFNVKDELEQLLADEVETVPEIPEEPIQTQQTETIETDEVVLQHTGKEEIHVEYDTRRPNPIDFIVKLVIKLVKYAAQLFRNRAS